MMWRENSKIQIKKFNIVITKNKIQNSKNILLKVS